MLLLLREEEVQQSTMNKIPMVIMAAGVSSRMKRSSIPVGISKKLVKQSNMREKGFIQVGDGNQPIIFYIINNCIKAGIKDFYVILSYDSTQFQKYLRKIEKKLAINITFGFQDFYGKLKPIGTSDALFQLMNQFQELKKKRFLVCNSDNIYSTKAIRLLLNESIYNSMIAYNYKCLKFSEERLSSFSILKIKENFLISIIEKPNFETIKRFNMKFVSMNIFSFKGHQVYNYLKNCPINKERKEKEIATAIQNMISDNNNSMITFPLCEHVPDLTFKEDINTISKFLN
ncbi:MAG: nucleotidyltransferase [Flavobacteriaceae bacterium]|nr:nucleotidyltransferase [Flavobacteriaceae bacterium]